MRENINSTIGDLLIWVTVLGTGVFVLEGLCVHFIGRDWVKLVFFLIGMFVFLRELVVEGRKQERTARMDGAGRTEGKLTLSEATKVCSMAMSFFPLVFLPGYTSSPSVRILLLLAFFPLCTFGLYRGRRKKEEEARKEEKRAREPLVLRDQLARSPRKAFIVCSRAREVDLQIEVDDRMFLYSLPGGRFLALFRKDILLDDFLDKLRDFRTEVEADEDAIGCYALPHGGPRPDLPLVFVCNQDMESRPFDFDPSTVPISSAVPV